ncbi:hypothetical protein G6F31_019087 [Rhizopus arrhizus]|nr:hypothetical protein G6F31_019087 [Rhizopus arrhizus]
MFFIELLKTKGIQSRRLDGIASLQFLYALNDDELLIPDSMRRAGNQMELAMKISLKMLSAAVLVAAPMSYLSAQPASPVGSKAQAYTSNVDRGLTRAEVRADLAMWKQAGMDAFWNQSETPDFYSREYKAAYADYHRLRADS